MEGCLKNFGLLLIVVIGLASSATGLSCYECSNGTVHSARIEDLYPVLSSVKLPNGFAIPPRPPAGQDLHVHGLCANLPEIGLAPDPLTPVATACPPETSYCFAANVTILNAHHIYLSKCMNKEDGEAASCDQLYNIKHCVCESDDCNKDVDTCTCTKPKLGKKGKGRTAENGAGSTFGHIRLIGFIAVISLIGLY